MRRLIYVPIIHISADLGNIASEVNKRGKNLVGDKDWKRHKKVILGFWDSIDGYFDALNVKNFKIYQDGLVANGVVGSKIVADGVKKGSKNYEVVSRLIKRGAQLVKTESFPAVKKEYDYLIQITKAKKSIKKIIAALNYKFHKKILLKKRDEFIAKTIDNTLKQDETGVLFLGSHHEIIPRLPEDIEIIEIKKRERINKYQQSLLSKRNKDRLNQLARYLISPIR
jgi:hypothetical protein